MHLVTVLLRTLVINPSSNVRSGLTVALRSGLLVAFAILEFFRRRAGMTRPGSGSADPSLLVAVGPFQFRGKPRKLGDERGQRRLAQHARHERRNVGGQRAKLADARDDLHRA